MSQKFDANKKEWDNLWELGNTYAQPSSNDLENYFEQGKKEINHILQLHAPSNHNIALDFGCGLGRLSRALSSRFKQVYAVDISYTALERAEELNKEFTNITYQQNNTGNLGMFNDDFFDFVYCARMLQHIPNKEDILRYISEFIRVLAPQGLLCFQVPRNVSFKAKFTGNRIYEILKPYLGQKTASRFLMTMNTVKVQEVRQLTLSLNVDFLDEVEYESEWFGLPSILFYVGK